MKALKIFLSLSAVLLLTISFGCSKDTPTETPTTTATTIPAAQEATVGNLAATQTLSGVEQVQGNMDMLSGGGFSLTSAQNDGVKNPPDTSWHYDTATHWWWQTFSAQYRWGVHLMPDPWSDTLVVNPDSLEFKYEWLDTTAYNFTYYYTIGWQTKPNTVHGLWKYDIPYYVLGVNYGYYWHMNFDNVGVNDHSGHFVYSGTYPVAVTTGYVMAAITGEITLIADGSGDGKVSAGGVEFCRMHFYADGVSPRGYYTLLSENWAIQHTFDSKK